MKKIKLIEEFKAFISKGNVVDMAVGVVVGGAFGKIVTSLVSDLIMPLVGLATGGGSLKDMFLVLGSHEGFDPAKYTTPALAAEAGYATLNSKLIHEKPEEPEPETEKTCPFCCTEIPIDAVKCPHCTSDLPEEETEAEKE